MDTTALHTKLTNSFGSAPKTSNVAFETKRKEAFDSFGKVGFPTPKNEEW